MESVMQATWNDELKESLGKPRWCPGLGRRQEEV